MTYSLGAASRANLTDVHPDLVRVVERAIQITTQDFSVLEGVRTREGMCRVYGQGRTAAECVAKGVPAEYARPDLDKVTWLNDPFSSNHRLMPDGRGHAVDIAPYPISWSLSQANISRFATVATAMKAAAAELGIAIGWGGDWKTKKDRPHFELLNPS